METKLRKMIASPKLWTEDISCIFSVKGGEDNAYFKRLSAQYGVTLLFYDSLLPKWLIGIRSIFPSSYGYFKLHNAKSLETVVDHSLPACLFGVYFVRKLIEGRLTKALEKPEGQDVFDLIKAKDADAVCLEAYYDSFDEEGCLPVRFIGI